MYHAFYRKNIYPFVAHYITNYTDVYGFDKQFTVDKLPDTALHKFAKLMMEYEECDLSFLADEDILFSICIVLSTIEREDKINLAEKILEKIVNHYQEKMQTILIIAQEELHASYLSENYESTIDTQTGETIWGAAINHE